MIDLRDYQQDAEDRARFALREHDRVLIEMATGSGKTELAMSITDKATSNENRTFFLVDRVTLANQTSRRFAAANIHHGKLTGEEKFGRNRNTVVSTPQTMMQPHRGFPINTKLIFVDECHTQYRKLNNFLVNQYQGKTLGLTATAMVPGLADTYETIITPVTTMQLLEMGFLTPVHAFGARRTKQINTDKLVVGSNGEWTAESIHEGNMEIVGDVVTSWVERTLDLFGCHVKTLLFGETVADCEMFCREFQKAGFDFRTTSFKDSPEETERKIRAFRNDEFIGFASVEKLIKGFDVPGVLFIIDCRPLRKALHVYIQMLGRGMRLAPGKKFFGLNCHTGNYEEFLDDVFGFYENGTGRLLSSKEKMKVERKKVDPKEVSCKDCGCVIPPKQELCPSCGTPRAMRQSNTRPVPGYMVELEAIAPGSRRWRENKQWVWQQMCMIAIEWKRGDKEKAKKLALAQYKNMYDKWPPYDWGFYEKKNSYDEGDNRVKRAMYRQSEEWRSTRKKSDALKKAS